MKKPKFLKHKNSDHYARPQKISLEDKEIIDKKAEQVKIRTSKKYVKLINK
jgi:hypothetical protein